MIFEVIDNKHDCFGFFFDGKVYKDLPNKNEQHFCWTYNPVLDNYNNVDYVSLYCGGKTISEVCPQHIAEDWKYLNTYIQNEFKRKSK